VTLKAEISGRPLSEDELHVRELNKRATEIKATDIHGAVQCIKEAHDIAKRTGAFGHPMEFWLRLPLFLQEAGEMEAAEVVFHQIEREIKAGVYGDARSAFLRILNRKRDLARDRESRAIAKREARTKKAKTT
jgi:hypothetical protein